MVDYTEINVDEEEKTEQNRKWKWNWNWNKDLGKFERKAVYVSWEIRSFSTNNEVNYENPEWLPKEKIDLDVARKLIEYKSKYTCVTIRIIACWSLIFAYQVI